MPIDSPNPDSMQLDANSQPPTHEAPPSSPPPTSPAEYRYTSADGVDEWMIGKTAREVAHAASRFVQTASTPSFAPPQTTVDTNRYQPAPTSFAPQPPDPNLMYSDPAAYQQQAFAYQQALFQQQLQNAALPMMQQSISLTRESAKRGKFADVWRRFEPEILGEVQKVLDPRLHTIELYETAAEIVQGRHWRDFAKDEAERMIASGGMGTERSGSGSNAPPAHVPADKLDEAWNSDHPYFQRARSNFQSASEFRAHITHTLKQPVNKFVDAILAQQVISTGRGFTRSEA